MVCSQPFLYKLLENSKLRKSVYLYLWLSINLCLADFGCYVWSTTRPDILKIKQDHVGQTGDSCSVAVVRYFDYIVLCIHIKHPCFDEGMYLYISWAKNTNILLIKEYKLILITVAIITKMIEFIKYFFFSWSVLLDNQVAKWVLEF